MIEFPTTVAELLAIPHPVVLGPGTPNAALRERIAAAVSVLAPVCAAGLWLRFDFLDDSHAISQEVETPDFNFWHAIMHRREPDAWNSKYWFRRVGNHPVLAQLREHAPQVGYAYTTPEAFVDFCEQVRGSGSDEEEVAKRVQQLEWQLLFDWCFERAVGT